MKDSLSNGDKTKKPTPVIRKTGKGQGDPPSYDESSSRNSEDIEKWTFITHLQKRYGRGERQFQVKDLFSIRKEYKEFQALKEQSWQKYEAYETVIGNATDTVEFYVLIILSCLIATFGLFANSGATIIGAMIVAPLMGPILGVSASILWGRGKDLWEAASTLFKGILLVLGITAGITFLLPHVPLGDQITSRTHPGLLDIGIAIASGLVGAYAYANKKISNSLPGVAISVALLPPLCTVGIGLGLQDWQIARGAATLFAVNLLGISLAALLVFYLVGMHPHITMDKDEKIRLRSRAFGQVFLTAVLLAALAVPMVFFSINSMKTNLERSAIHGLTETWMAGILQEDKILDYSAEIVSTEEGWRITMILYPHRGDSQLESLFSTMEVQIPALEKRLEEEISSPVQIGIYQMNSIH